MLTWFEYEVLYRLAKIDTCRQQISELGDEFI